MSDTENKVDQVEAQVAPHQANVPTASSMHRSNEGMGLRLGIILGCFLIAIAGIVGFQYYLSSQMPSRANDVARPGVDANTDMGDSSGGMPQAPGA